MRQTTLTQEQIRELNPLALAYIGDVVYELAVRTHLAEEGSIRVNDLHKEAVKFVNAQRQSELYAAMEELLTEEEQAVLRRGRNAKSGHQPPHVTVGEYRRATGVEALVGWLYLNGREDRLNLIFALLFGEKGDPQDGSQI